MHITTLILRCNAQSFLSVNAAALGEVGPRNALSMPVAPDGVYYLCAMPLTGGYAAAARKIELSGGVISEANSGVSAVCWPGGAIEISIELEPLAAATPYEPASTISQVRMGPVVATLFRESGIHLAIESETDTLFSHTVAPRGVARMEHTRAEGGRMLYAVAKDEETMYCCCVYIGERIEITYEAQGGSFNREGMNITRIEPLASKKGYEKREVVDAMTGNAIESETGFFTREAHAIESAADACEALLDAVRLGLPEELDGLLGGALEGLGMDDLRDFFGDFSRSVQPPSHFGDMILLGLTDDARVSTARLFSFECENNDGWRVINASEL